jgi:hypothetical protein
MEKDPMNKPTAGARPIRYTAEVCLNCGSASPSRPSPGCAHGRTALLGRLDRGLADRVTRVRALRLDLDAAVRAMGERIDLEVMAGRARYAEDGPVEAPGENVTVLRPRGEIADCDR